MSNHIQPSGRRCWQNTLAGRRLVAKLAERLEMAEAGLAEETELREGRSRCNRYPLRSPHIGHPSHRRRRCCPRRSCKSRCT